MNKIFIVFLIIQTIIFSCSSNNSNTNSDIFNGDYDNLKLSKESFEKIGFKFSKEYKVKGLPDALSVLITDFGEKSLSKGLHMNLDFTHQTKLLNHLGFFMPKKLQEKMQF